MFGPGVAPQYVKAFGSLGAQHRSLHPAATKENDLPVSKKRNQLAFENDFMINAPFFAKPKNKHKQTAYNH